MEWMVTLKMISVIIPVYNVEQYLRQCIESVSNQTHKKLEIILVDDGSTDSSGKICDEFAKKDNRIAVIHQKNQGVTQARNAGLRISHGEYIGFVDGDDWIEPNMYSSMYYKIVNENVDIVMCGHFDNVGTEQREVPHGVYAGKYEKERIVKELYPQMISGDRFFEYRIFLTLWDKLFRRNKLIKFQLQVDERIVMGEDIACVVPYLLDCSRISVMRECLYHYRQSLASTIKRIPDREVGQYRILYQAVQKSLDISGFACEFRRQWRDFYLFMAVPRADHLYQGFKELDYLFPFPQIKQGSSIALYCAGTYGQRLYSYLQQTNFCKVVIWVDQAYEQFQAMGLPVKNPEALAHTEGYSSIVVANMFAHSREAIYQTLHEKYPDKSVCLIDEKLIFSAESLCAFGILEDEI